MALRLYYCDHHHIPLPDGHRFPTAKYRLLRERLAGTGAFDLHPAPLVDAGAIARMHTVEYVHAFLAGKLDPAVMRRIGFPWSEGLVMRTLASVGGTLAATADALECGIAGTLAGGTHHAFPGEGAGFCVFNDIAIAIRRYAVRAAVVDLDVHQGDGTAHIFENDESVLTISVHGRNNFPFRKQRSSIDVELPDGAGDAEYLDAVREVLPRAWAFEPGVVFYQSGVDALATDRLGRLALTHDGLLARDQLVLGGCKSLGIPCVITLGGGYSEPIEATVEAHANTFLTAAALFATTAA